MITNDINSMDLLVENQLNVISLALKKMSILEQLQFFIKPSKKAGNLFLFQLESQFESFGIKECSSLPVAIR